MTGVEDHRLIRVEIEVHESIDDDAFTNRGKRNTVANAADKPRRFDANQRPFIQEWKEDSEQTPSIAP
jgi:hypothetical protein